MSGVCFNHAWFVSSGPESITVRSTPRTIAITPELDAPCEMPAMTMSLQRGFRRRGTKPEAFEGIAILATNMAQTLDEALQRRTIAPFHFRAPSPAARAEIWRKHLPAKLPLARDVDVEDLARTFELTGG